MKSQLIEVIKDKISEKEQFIIGIGGFGGSGKTTLANALQKELGAKIIELDDFYSPELGQADLQRVLEQVLTPLSENRSTKYQIYDWKNEKMGEWRNLEPKGVVILEGVMALHTDLLPYLDFKIWIDYSQEKGFIRGVQRDKERDNIDNTEKWKNIWMPQEKEYVEKQNPKQYADYTYKLNELHLVSPSNEYKKSYLEALKEAREEDGETQLLKPSEGQSFEDFVKIQNDNAKGLSLPPGYIPATTFWLIDNDGIMGRIQIRHELTEKLNKEGGHIGYYIKPSKRGMGYGNKILEMGLIEAKRIGLTKVLITCDDDNVGSWKIIESNGGVLENIVESDTSNKTVRRYWIDI